MFLYLQVLTKIKKTSTKKNKKQKNTSSNKKCWAEFKRVSPVSFRALIIVYK
jgi:hypothetical protein